MSVYNIDYISFSISVPPHAIFLKPVIGPPQPSECGRQRTLNIVHAQTAAQQQSNGCYEARMSGKCEEWRDYFIMTLSPIRWVPVQDKGSEILYVKLGATKVIPSDPLHQ